MYIQFFLLCSRKYSQSACIQHPLHPTFSSGKTCMLYWLSWPLCYLWYLYKKACAHTKKYTQVILIYHCCIPGTYICNICGREIRPGIRCCRFVQWTSICQEVLAKKASQGITVSLQGRLPISNNPNCDNNLLEVHFVQCSKELTGHCYLRNPVLNKFPS